LKKNFNILSFSSVKFKGMRVDRRLLVFLFFIAVSAVIWFLNALGREYITQLNYPVRYTNYPDNMVLARELPSSLELTVNAYGYTLIRHYIGRRMLPIVFDVNSFSLNRMPETDTRNFYVLSSVAAARIAGQLGSDIEILDIRPDTLIFRFSDMMTALLPVRPVLDLQFEQQFMIRGEIIVEPDSVYVSGPGIIVDTMRVVPTMPLRRTAVKQPVSEVVRLQQPESVNLSDDRVRITVPVDQFTEANLRIPIETVNLPDTLTMKTFPAAISVSYLVALPDYERVNPQHFRAVVDYQNIHLTGGRLTVELLSQPAFVRNVRFTPHHVDYIIEK
jgi:hypothetical protein